MSKTTKPTPISYEEFQEKVANLRTVGDVTDFAKSLVAPTLQAMLEAEMEQHVGYPKNARTGSKNSRNGSYKKKIKTSMGEAEIAVPRDREGSYEPLVVRKYETVESEVEERIVAMYAKGLTTRDIAQYMRDIYGVEVSSTMVSRITDKVMPLVREWQNRPLESVYVALYLDGMFYKVREGGKIVKKCVYIALGITQSGIKEVLGLWTADTQGAKFWMGVCNELKNRGVEDIFIACVDGLKGFGDAIRAIFPDVQVQRCVVHMIRNTTKYVPHRHKKAFCASLRTVYTAPTEEAAIDALENVKTDWPAYSVYLQRWEDNWDELSPMFAYPEPIRRIIYTTNTIESLNRQLRKVTKTTTIFPHEEALQKLLWLAQDSVSRKWTMPIRNWGEIVPQLAILFPSRFHL